MARTVKDAALLLGALTGVDEADSITKESSGKSYTDYSIFLKKESLAGKRIGIEKSHLNGHEGIVAMLKEAMETMTRLGATMVEVELLKPLRETGNAEFEVLCFEFKDGLNRFLATTSTKMKTLEDIIAFNNQHEDTAMPFFKQETLITCQAKAGLDSKEYKDALNKSLSSRKIITDLMSQNNLDAISGVTNGPACCIDLVSGDYDTGYAMSTPAAMAGFPHITVPMGFIHSLPVGISFLGKAYAEPSLLGMAFAYEQASKKRAAPLFRQDLLG